MIVAIWKKLSGFLTLEITSADPEKTLDFLTQKNISFSQVIKKCDLTYQIRITRKEYSKLNTLLNPRGDRIRILGKSGLYWDLTQLFRRPFLLLTFLLLLLLSIYLPGRILFVSVVGNKTLPENQILSAAQNCGIGFAASRKQVRSEKVKNALLAAVPQLQWAAVNTSGCRAIISVQERVPENIFTDIHEVTSLIADRDGHILSTTITSGTGYVAPGDSVKAGELLISGYTDCGICIRAARAAGEIIAQTNRELNAVMPANCSMVSRTQDKGYHLTLVFGKKRINLWKDSRISTGSCDRMYQEYYLSLPGGFRLPVAVCIDQFTFYEIQTISETEHHAHKQLKQFAEDYLIQQMVAGKIMSKQEQLTFSDGLYTLEGSYICREMIGKQQREQIGDFNGKRD